MTIKMTPRALTGEAAIYADTKPSKHDFPRTRCACSRSDPSHLSGQGQSGPHTGRWGEMWHWGGRA